MKTPSIGDRVKVSKEKLEEILDEGIKKICSGVGIVSANYNSGYFLVDFCGYQHGFYGDELEIIATKMELDEMVREEKLAKQIEMANDMNSEVEYD